MVSKTLSVLLIDDDSDTRNLFNIVMDHYHLQSATAENAQNAFAYLNSNTPDVIILDIILPDMDGYRALDYIREKTGASGASIVATTAYYTDSTQADVMERGFNGYLPKPLNPTSLVPYLQGIVARR